MSRSKSNALIILGIAAGLGITWLIGKRRSEINGLQSWLQVLHEHYGREKTSQLATAIRQQVAAILAETVMPKNLVLRWHLKERIVPGLALYQILLIENGGSKPAALAVVDEAFRAWSLSTNRCLAAPLKVLPSPFQFFRLVFPFMMKQYPAEGWDYTYIENNADKVAFNATRCFYLNTLTGYGAPELTPSFCKTDDVMAELFPPSIHFERSQTLGRGDTVCDFQYCRSG